MTVPEDIPMQADGVARTLNGAGIRRRFIVGVRVGALLRARLGEHPADAGRTPGLPGWP